MKLAPQADIIRTVFVLIVLFGGLQLLYIISQNKTSVRAFEDLRPVITEELTEDNQQIFRRPDRPKRIYARLSWDDESDDDHVAYESRIPPLRLKPETFFRPPTHPLVYGSHRPNKGYLTIGIPSVRRPNTDRIYLFDTLDSLIQNSWPSERNLTTLVVMLSDINTTYNKVIAKQVYNNYKYYCECGYIHIIIPNKGIYPNLDRVRKTYNDGPSRLKWRAKQNVDYSFLFMYSANISSYYMQLEDDVISATGFFSEIRNFIDAQGKRAWFLLEFSFLGFIGKLFHSHDLGIAARYMLTYFDSMPCDLLLGKLRTAKGQKMALHTKKSLFQHLGKFSSLENKMMPALDAHFKDADLVRVKQAINNWPKGDNPPAYIRTSFLAARNSSATSAYDNDLSTYQHVHTPTKGDYFQLQFTRAYNFSRIIIITGDEAKRIDTLTAGSLMYARDLITVNKSSFPTRITCGVFRPLSGFVSGELDTQATGTFIPTRITCLKILLTKRNRTWLILREIILIL